MLNLTMFLIHFLGQPLATAKTWAGSSPPATAEQSSGLWKVWQSHPRAMAPQHRWPCQDIIFCSVGIVNDLTSPLHMLNATEKHFFPVSENEPVLLHSCPDKCSMVVLAEEAAVTVLHGTE